MTELTKNSQDYLQLFEQSKTLLAEHSVALLDAQRDAAIKQFESLGGFPTTKVEDYKYTNIDKLFELDYGIDIKNTATKFTNNMASETPLSDAYTLYLKNGLLQESEDIQKLAQQGVVACSLSEAAKEHAAIFSKYYNSKVAKNNNSLAALNTAFAQNGLFFYVPKNVVLDKAVQVVNFLQGKDDMYINPRHLFIVEKSAKAQIIDCTHAANPHKFLTNTVIELFVEENAKAECYILQNQFDKSTILANIFVGQKRNSEVLTNILSLNANIIRNNVNVDLEEENCENHTYGAYLAGGKQHIDNFTAINHIAPHCNSWEHFKGILDNNATTAFCGRIHVHKDAQKTEAYQTNNNLVLSNNAKSNTKPQLIIEADDVSCSHGATVGQLDDKAIFYLRARGIPYNEAYRMMMIAFMNEVASKIKIEELRERVENWIANKMVGKITYCDCCKTKCHDAK